ncbi:MAG: flippase-like domain-containing protein [Syntrophobacteraceae bacterium]|nr:flippase-like domain-containing protein [Syntrophobacteraceae bacterium]
MRRFNLILLIAGTVFLYWMLKQLGWASLGLYLGHAGYYWPLLFLPYGLVNLLWALSWGFLLPDKMTRPSPGRLFLLHLAGESLNQLTPTASMGGEPFKVFRLRDLGVPWEEATASVVIHKGLFISSLAFYCFLGVVLTPFLLSISVFHLRLLSLAVLALGAGAILFLIVQRKSPCVSAMRLLEKCGLCPKKLKEKERELLDLDLCLAGFYRKYPRRIFLSFLALMLGWLFHAVEAGVFFRLMGHPINFGQGLCLDALATIFASIGFMIPGALGIQDSGTVLVALGLDLGASLAGAFAILRRIREAFWLSTGLLAATVGHQKATEQKPAVSSL